ncbi:22811_t:CDS:1, partial [Gigaspora rosea]
SKVIQKLDLLVQYYSELENILGSLNEYNVYEKHYNQVIRNDNFIKRLQNNLQFSTSINKECNSFKEQLKKLQIN